jgi:hypothetical protein
MMDSTDSSVSEPLRRSRYSLKALHTASPPWTSATGVVAAVYVRASSAQRSSNSTMKKRAPFSPIASVCRIPTA